MAVALPKTMTNLPKRLFTRLKALPLPLLILAGTLLLVFILFALRPQAERAPDADLKPLVATLPAALQTLRPTITLYGRVESPRQSTLSATVNAYVKTVAVEEGHAVSAGQLLVELDVSDVQLILAQRQAEVADIEAQIESEKQRHRNDVQALAVEKELLTLSRTAAQRHEKLAASSAGSALSRDEAQQAAQRQALNLLSREHAVQDHPNRLQRLQAQLDKARALRDQAALDLARSRITAPFDGRVTAVNVSPGNRVRPGDLVVTVFDQAHLEVRAQIPSRYLQAVHGALRQQVAMDASLALDGQRIPLLLDRLASAVSMGQGGVDALFRLQDPTTALTLGRSGEVYLLMPPLDNVMQVPATAIYGQNRIYQVKDNRLHTIMIERLGETLLDNGEQWPLIRAHVEPGAAILVTQLSNAVGGMAVKLSDTAGAQP